MTKKFIRPTGKNRPVPKYRRVVNPSTNPLIKNTSWFQHPQNYVISLVSVFAIGIFSGFLIWGKTTPVIANASDNGSAGQQQVTRISVDEGDNPSIGPVDAPITIIEFSDYQCPYCQKWATQVYQKLFDEYPTQIRLVYRDFPLTSIHPEALPAAAAANCANEQDSYWEFHDKLFSYEFDLGIETYLKYAQELNLDMPSFTSCLESNRYVAEVIADQEYGAGLGITGTPAFYINGLFVVGAQPFETFKKLIDQELAGVIP